MRLQANVGNRASGVQGQVDHAAVILYQEPRALGFAREEPSADERVQRRASVPPRDVDALALLAAGIGPRHRDPVRGILAGQAERGWHQTPLRDVAAEAGVSVGLLYRYFPSKRAVVLALYDDLSARYAVQAQQMQRGRWRDRFLYALTTSLGVLEPHRGTLSALVPVLVGDAEEGLFAPGTAFSRLRVQAVFVEAVGGATDAPRGPLAPALGRMLYLLHLAGLLWWLLDRSPDQRATWTLVTLLEPALRLAAPALRVPGVSGLIVAADALVREALFGEAPEGPR
ncbi:MAG: TetR/AcrR family transcriptional regulator [Chloroflexi bacterium]|nr:TetR/AcrR family transcriptional regulator [Chloroflexota bacterium]